MILLTDEQQRIVDHPMTPLLVVAGAGTGKTTVMAERMAAVIRNGDARPSELLGLTFTNKASAELARRVREATGVADVAVSTYHGFAAGLVNDHRLELDLHPRQRLLGRAEAWQLLFEVFDEFRFEKRSSFAPGIVVDAALKLASRCADQLVTVDQVEADCERIIAADRWEKATEAAKGRRELCQVVRAYDECKRRRHLIDWGDQIRLAVELLDRHPELAGTLYDEHPVVLLDEYQDTNFAQRVLLSRIYPRGSAITAVGDDMQSIYAFRGAHLENILNFAEQWDAEVLPLSENRRSGAELVELANRAQKLVKGRTLPKLLRAKDDAPPTSLECFLAADEAEEARTIAADIAAVGVPWSGSAVLCRKRRVIPAVVAALEDLGIPVEVIGTSGLLSRPEIVDIVAWLEVLAGGSTGVPLVRLLQGPRYRMGMRDLAALVRAGGGGLDEGLQDLDSVTELSADGRARLLGFMAERAELQRAARLLPLVDVVETIVDRTSIWAAAGGKGRENILRFVDLAASFEATGDGRGLVGFVEHLQLIEESEEDVAEAHLSGDDAVRVMTVHQAKGLEFPNVWVPGLAKNVFPDERTGENPVGWQHALPWWVGDDDTGLPTIHDGATTQKEVEDAVRSRHRDEESRLFYVACTRAQRRLVLSAAHWYAGASKPQGPSDLFGFVLAQDDLVHPRFQHEPATIDPQVAAMERRRRHALETETEAGTVAGGGEMRRASRAAPHTLTVSDLVTYDRCPRQGYWTFVRPLPRRATGASRIGIQVHAWIEAGAPSADDHGGGSGVVSGLRRSFQATPYAGLEPEAREVPFVLPVGRSRITGRIDAVYRRNGFVDLVDFKTGLATGPVQLDLYALAAVELWGLAPEQLTTTYCYLSADGEPRLDSATCDGERIERVRKELTASVGAMDAGEWQASPGPYCGGCDFLAFCPPGQSASGITA